MNEISKRVEPIAPAVVITGATQGLGKALAEEFARASHTLLLVARDEAALAATAKALAKTHNVEVKFVAADLCTVEGVWVTSERRHWEARKGVGARGRARRPEGVWSVV